MNILFVCTGNMSRSPMAEYLLKKMLKDAGLNSIHVSSRGTSPAEFAGIASEAARILDKEGIDTTRHKPRPLDQESVEKADLVLAMHGHHVEEILTRFPQAREKTKLLKPYAGIIGDPDVADPGGQGDEAFHRAAEEIKKCLKVVVNKIKQGGLSSE